MEFVRCCDQEDQENEKAFDDFPKAVFPDEDYIFIFIQFINHHNAAILISID